MERDIPSSSPELPESVVPSGAVHLGRDAEGADHYLLRTQRVIGVVRHTEAGDELEAVESVEHRPVQDWMDYVRAERGWTAEKYDARPFAEWALNPRVPQEEVDA